MVLVSRIYACAPVHGHDHPGGAESALRSVELGQPLLDGVEALGLVPESLHGCDAPSVAAEDRSQALESNGALGADSGCEVTVSYATNITEPPMISRNTITMAQTICGFPYT